MQENTQELEYYDNIIETKRETIRSNLQEVDPQRESDMENTLKHDEVFEESLHLN